MRILLLALLTLVAGFGGCTTVPTCAQLKATTLRLQFTDGICSGTAIGRALIRTAAHCFKTGKLVLVNDRPATALAVTPQGKDTVDVFVAGQTFDHWAQLGPRPLQGDRVRWWGNPAGDYDVYREGYVSRSWTDGLLIDATVCRGDSGAGIFNAQGQVVGVVSGMNNLDGCTFMVSLPVHS